jgi:cell division protein FtsW
MSLAFFGVVMVGTASPSVATRIDLGPYHFLIRHVIFLMPALTVMIGIAWLSHQNIWRFASLLFGLSLIGVVMALVSGQEIKGAMRWIYIFGFSIQPSEFLKPAFVILSAWFLSKQKMQINFPGVMIALCLYGVSAALLLMQPDFGMFFLVSIVFGMQIFLAGCPLRYILVLGGIGLIAVIMAYFSLAHVQDRVNDFLFPESGDSYQVDLSKEAFMNGGIIGTGLGQGSVKNQVPDIHSDFIFTAVGEEWGLIMGGLLVVCFGYIFYRIFNRISRSESIFVMLAAGGLCFMLAMQTFIHMGSALQLIPAKGMTLPFISYGGSSLISVGISFGLILALSRGILDDKRQSGWRHLKKGQNL